MQIDNTTLADLGIFSHDEESSMFHYLNFTQTNGGREHLRWILQTPLADKKSILDTQKTIQHLQNINSHWPLKITNGTVMVVASFFDSAIEGLPSAPVLYNSFLYKLINPADFALARYTVNHAIDFLKGMHKIAAMLSEIKDCDRVEQWQIKITNLLNRPVAQEMVAFNELQPRFVKVVQFAQFLKAQYKQKIFDLIQIYAEMDAYLSLAKVCTQYQLNFPFIAETEAPFINAKGLYHLLLKSPVAYDVALEQRNNFLFLTGANMGGKSTLIKAVGLSVYLAQIGMGVPAEKMEISYFDGLLTNINVMDNVIKGESYFYNEVHRIKNTVEQISDGKKWLILVDELFKGTNIQDAMKCSTVVIEGLLKIPKALFVLSTHLYEIGDHLRKYPQIQFRYFETNIVDDQLLFSYQLKEGISNDRIGYLILKREGVVDLLEKI
jgi:DNA mismatch repair protein MutS